MKITAYDLKHTLTEPEELPGKRVDYKRHGHYTQIKNFPGREVSINTAYRRWQRNPELSIEDVCLTPLNSGRQCFAHRNDLAYLMDLSSEKTHSEIARKWGINYNTVARHRNEESKR